jgi:hypothetical protein
MDSTPRRRTNTQRRAPPEATLWKARWRPRWRDGPAVADPRSHRPLETPALRSRGDVGSPASGNETELLVEAVHSRVHATALHQHVMTIDSPGSFQRGPHHRATVTTPAKLGMRDHVLQEAVTPALTEQVGRRHQHTRRRDARAIVGHEDIDTGPFERLPPHPLSTFEWLDGGADLRGREQTEEGR